ncbi:MAG: HAMP domain-containing protein [Candidatus Omnitrophica bacterium]|nr:HAMP domain-containing protein [Candidatus Omnitrophota bacterium]
MALKEFFVRRKFLIQKEFQLKFVGFLILVILAISALVVLTVNLSIWAAVEKGVSSQVQIVIDQILHNMNVLFMFEIPIVLLISIFAAIIFSHKIAGPVYRLQQAAIQVVRGDLTSNVHLRRDDELKNLSSAFNSVVDNMHLLVAKDRKLITALSAITDTLYTNLKDKKISQDEALVLIRKLNDLVGELRTLIMQYKIEKS